MSAPALVTQADIERALSAAKKSGLQVQRARLSRDGFDLFFYRSDGADDAPLGGEEIELE